MQGRLRNSQGWSIYYEVLAQLSVRDTSALPMVTLFYCCFCSLYQMLNSFAAAMWALRFDNSGWHFPGCGCVINLTKFTSRLVSPWEIGHRFHLALSLLFSLSVQHPVPYNTWQLKEIHYSEEVSDVESAPRTVPKTSCEPEQPSREKQSTEHTQWSNLVTKLMEIT